MTGAGSHAIDKNQFCLLSLQDADQYWEIAIPTVDAPLVRAALHGAGTAT
ncbi:hypothetical protein [Streptomyces sp. NPDC059874]